MSDSTRGYRTNGIRRKLEENTKKLTALEVKVAIIDTRLKIGFGVLAVLNASPKLGGPSADQVVHALLTTPPLL